MKYIITSIITMGIFTFLYANQAVEVKVEFAESACLQHESSILINLFVRKAENINDVVLLENQNYRIKFNSSTLNYNSFYIDSEGQLSSFGNNPTSGQFYLFDEHNLTGTKENILSYNIDHLGGEGYELTHDWILIGKIGASFRSNAECFSTIIQDEAIFPPTTLIYHRGLNDNFTKHIDLNPVTQHLNNCIADICNNCYDFLDLQDIENDYVNGEIFHHKVRQYIQAENKISNGASITFDVSENAILKPGFEVHSSATFEVKMEGCDN